jgi:hypothetical protein
MTNKKIKKQIGIAVAILGGFVLVMVLLSQLG